MAANNSTPSTTAPIADLTSVEQWLQYVVFYIGFGSLGIVGNLALGVAIGRHKEFRSRFFIIVRTLVVVRCTIGYQFVVTGAYRALKTAGSVDPNQKRITCNLLHLFIHVSFTVELALLLVLVIDRMIAILAPMAYRKLTRRQAELTCLLVLFGVGVVAKMLPSFVGLGDDLNELVPCVNAYSAPKSPMVNLYMQNTDLPLIVIVLCLYCVLWIAVRVRIRGLESREFGVEESELPHLRRQLAVLPLLRNIVLAHSAVTLMAKVLAALIVYFPSQSIRLTAYSGNMNTVDLVVNVGVLLWSNADLKRAVIEICGLRWKKQPAVSTGGNVASGGLDRWAANHNSSSRMVDSSHVTNSDDPV